MALPIIVSIVLVLIIYWYLSIPKNLPPGPLNFPLIGHYLHWHQVHKKLLDLGKKYGPICSFYRFSQLVVVINDYDLIKQTILKQGDCFVGKLDNSYALRAFHAKEGLVYTDGDRWREQRRFSLSTLRDLGFGRPILEQSIVDEIQSLLPVLRSYAKQTKSINPQDLLEKSVANVICRLIFGKRYDYEDVQYNRLVRQVVKVFSRVHLGSLIGFQAWFRHLPVIRGLWKSSLMNQANMYTMLERFIQEHNDRDEVSIESNDYIDAFRKQQKEGKGRYFNDAQLLYAVRDLFGAGLDTTSSTLLWALLLCATHPDIQERCQHELDTACDSNEATLQDRTKTPFVEATLMEVQRFSSVLPFLSRRTTKEVEIGPYVIPEGTAIFANLWALHMDGEYFDNPQHFKPDRFIDPQTGKLNGKDEYLIPFGLGKRVCMGEALARMELYLFFTALIRHFTFSLPNGSPAPRLDSLSGITLRPYPYEVLVHRRQFDYGD